ncbi:unnamed protein product [Linum trigynum]|uniref:Uncharacterized protein n=1 Tax=Linum trigynum TaxID=586398 RepID=A0AAV2DF58_9ROSI
MRFERSAGDNHKPSLKIHLRRRSKPPRCFPIEAPRLLPDIAFPRLSSLHCPMEISSQTWKVRKESAVRRRSSDPVRSPSSDHVRKSVSDHVRK